MCNALIEKVGFLLRSKPITIASTFWPVWKRSGRCSSRSRPRSLRLMKPVAPSSPAWTSRPPRSEEHTSELQSLMRISYAVFCLNKKKHQHLPPPTTTQINNNYNDDNLNNKTKNNMIDRE